MKTGFLKHYFVIGLLSGLFFIAGFLFLNSYAAYSINQQKLLLLRGQERFLKNQIRELEEKKKQLAVLDRFVNMSRKLSLTGDQWDVFHVELEQEPFTFSNLNAILSQTENTQQYVFQPESLSIRLGSVQRKDGERNQSAESPVVESEPGRTNQREGTQGVPDAVVDLKGRFLVKKRGVDD